MTVLPQKDADSVIVRYYTNDLGRTAISGSRELRAATYATLPSEIPAGASPRDVESLREIESGRGANYIDFPVSRSDLAGPEGGPTTSGGGRRRQLLGPDVNQSGCAPAMSPERQKATCPHCCREFEYARYHAGFGNQGYMYCDQDETVLTWDTYVDPYSKLTSKHPWMLDSADQSRVEAALKPCPYGGSFAFANPSLCPFCHESIAFLVPSKEYFIVAGRRVEADDQDMWIL